jgi:hypothetical protein
VFCLTDFVCTTTDSGYNIRVEGDSRGFRQSEKRNFELALHLASKPDRVTVGGERIKASSQKACDALRAPVQWMWDEKSHTCRIRIPDNCNRTEITVTGN